MIGDGSIVDPRATVEVESPASGAHNRAGDLFYILNAPAKLRASQIGAPAQPAKHPKIARQLQRSLASWRIDPHLTLGSVDVTLGSLIAAHTVAVTGGRGKLSWASFTNHRAGAPCWALDRKTPYSQQASLLLSQSTDPRETDPQLREPSRSSWSQSGFPFRLKPSIAAARASRVEFVEAQRGVLASFPEAGVSLALSISLAKAPRQRQNPQERGSTVAQSALQPQVQCA